MSKKWTVRHDLLRRGSSFPCRLARGVACSGVVLFGLLIASPMTIARERPATERPVLVDRLPDSSDLLLRGGGRFAVPIVHRDGEGFTAAPPMTRLGTTALRRSTASGFSNLLMDQMHREINRLEKRERDDLVRMTPAWADIEDSHMEQVKARHAERIVTKSLNRAVDIELERLARTTFGLGEAWTWVENFGRQASAATAIGTRGRQEAAVNGAPPPRFSAGVGFVVATRPRVILRTEFFKVRGHIDIPLRNDPITITLDRQIGSHAHVRLMSGLSRGEGNEWVNLSLRLGF